MHEVQRIFPCIFLLISYEEDSDKRLYLAVIRPGGPFFGKKFSVNLYLIENDSETTGLSGLKFTLSFYGIMLAKHALLVFAVLH